jgi:hypothetical protein
VVVVKGGFEMVGMNQDLERRVSRAAAVKLGAMAAAGAAAAALAAPDSASADSVDGSYEADSSLETFAGPAYTTSNESGFDQGGADIGGVAFGVRGRCVASNGADGSNDGTGNGIEGYSGTGNGVYGQSSAIGVLGVTSQSSGVGVKGAGTLTADGVFGTSGGNGVHGQTTNASSGVGVYGESAATGGTGVSGLCHSTTSGQGVLGTGPVGVSGMAAGAGPAGGSGAGTGVLGTTQNGTGVQAQALGQSGTGLVASAVGPTATAVSASNPAGIGLSVAGINEFSRSGIATIKGTATSPKSAVRVSGVLLGPPSIVLATIQTNNAPGVFIQSAVPSVVNSWITITLNQPVSKTVKIGWFIIN